MGMDRLTDEERAAIAAYDGPVRRVDPPCRSSWRRVGDVAVEVVARAAPPGPAPRELREMGVRAALEWAFGIEHARLSYGDVRGKGLPPFGMEYLMMERAMLGQEVDVSRGRSAPADDAELIAAAVQGALPPRAALRLAELAIAGQTPWQGDVEPRLEPEVWVCSHGHWRGKRDDAARLGSEGWRPTRRRNRKGVMVEDIVWFTPCRWTTTAAAVAAKRRAYLDWWGDLLTVREALHAVGLRWVRITDAMPPLRPWDMGA